MRAFILVTVRLTASSLETHSRNYIIAEAPWRHLERVSGEVSPKSLAYINGPIPMWCRAYISHRPARWQ